MFLYNTVTREISGTHSVSGMVGNRLISPSNVNVVLPLILIMHYAVIRAVFLCIGTMKYEILQRMF